jgi:glycosyltransferase involved in cell wall biosynthesis
MRRLLQITDSFGYTGGIRSYIKHASDLLADRGWEVEIYSPAGPGGGLRSHFTRWAGWRYLAEVREAVDRFRPHLLHAHSLSLRLSPLPLRAAVEHGIPVVMTVHDFNHICPRKWMVRADGRPCPWGFGCHCLLLDCPSTRSGLAWAPYHGLRWLKTALHRRMLRAWVDTFISPSAILGQWMESSLGAENVATVPNFVHPPDDGNQPQGRRSGLLYVGRLSREKGVDVLLRAMPLILESAPRTLLTVVGDGPDRPALESLAGTLGIGEAVSFTGPVENRLLGRYYRAGAACVLPSLWMENCPVTALEALAHGMPLLASDLGGLPEIVREGTTGLLFPRGDHRTLAKQAVRLLVDQEGARQLGAGVLEVFREEYSPDAHFARLTAVYEALMK